MRSLRYILAMPLAALAQPAFAGEEILFGAPPEWVVEAQSVRPSDYAEADMPVRVKFTNFQTRMEEDFTSHYVEIDMEFLTPQGLSGGDISINWSPEFDDLTVHHVLIERGDELIDVLAEGQTFNVLRREQNLDAAILNGVLTANMFPAGLEVGDVLRMAYTIKEANPVLRGIPEAVIGPLNGIVDQTFVRLSWPENIDIKLTASTGLPQLDRGRRRGYEYASLSIAAQEPLLMPSGAPARYQLVRMLEASPHDSWADLSHLFLPLYLDASKIAAQGPLRAELEKIRAASDDPVVRTEMALALVQDKVRYVALAMGAGGLLPADTASTWARRFGDCKAKTALLIGLLAELGVEAEPILVNTVMGDALPYRQPVVSAFDHVLVRAHIGGKTYFLDGTKTGETSLARLMIPHFSWGLPLLDAGAQLVPLVPPVMELPNEDVIVRMDASGGLRAPAPTQLEAIYRGDDAIATNNALAQMGGQARQQAIEEFWRGRYDYVTSQSVSSSFDRESGELRLSLTGTAEMDWGHNAFEPSGMRVGFTPEFTRSPGPDAEAPFAVPHPFFGRTTFIITLPDGFSAKDVEAENIDQSVAGLQYRREVGLEGNVFTATRSTRSLMAEFPFGEVEAAKPVLERLWEKRVFLNIPDGYTLSQDEIANMSLAQGEDVDDLIDQGTSLMDAGEWAAAFNVFDKALEIAPRSEWALADRAVVLVNLGRFDEAVEDFDKALAIDPDNFVAFQAKGLLAARKGDYPAAIEAFTAAFEARPDNPYALSQRAIVYATQENFEAALADTDRLLAIDPQHLYYYILKGNILAELGRKDEVQTHADAMLAAFPGDSNASSAASELLMQLGLEDRAEALLNQSLADGTSAVALLTSASRRSIGETDIKLREIGQALELEPDYVAALLMRADVLWAEYELTRALADANRALELAPDVLQGYATKFKILVDMDRNREAERMLDTMVERLAADPTALALAASSYHELNRTTKARATIELARNLAPDMPFVRSVSDRIEGRNLPTFVPTR